ncbi:hypothetical protein AXX17_AT4G08610 [Arabidopsis thaliana]|uniref:Reverse transcriptase Ty1/copia-type domain-containing protein n=1 Tax=Arabidopsis thaliana TaxID=3702 RepID=A0A178UVJ9_ARATH|nr:hypothetical protein AXX17_AT4G08610 [Arabidopsis thaliana]
MMSHTDLPPSLCGYALETSVFMLNRCSSKSVEKTPYEIWTRNVPNLSFLKIWGCEAYVKRLSTDKLGPKSDKCYFAGYLKETKGTSGSKVLLEEVREPHGDVPTSQEEHTLDLRRVVEPIHVEPEVRRSERSRHEPDRFGDWVTDDHALFIIESDEPTSYEKALIGPDSDKWLEAAKSEMESMSQNKIYKARLVAKGYKQIHGIDYDKTYFPVAMLKSIRILLATAAHYDYEIWQMDVKTAFLNGNLEEDVYMTQPEGFTVLEAARKVCKLHCSIYGLKRASRSWNARFNEAIKEFDFIRNEEEPCVYKKTSGSAVAFLVLYVDDILLLGNDIPLLQSVKTWLESCFSMKDMGSIMYAMLCTRPDVACALSMTSRYQSDPGESHWIVVKNILKYLRRTKDKFLVYGGSEELVVSGYTDASFQTDKDDFRSQSGFVFCLNGGALSWKSSKQSTVADSTTEAAASEAAKEAVWIRKFITELDVVPSISGLIDLYCDNNGAIAQAKEPRSHQKFKHIQRRYHLIRDTIDRGDVKISRLSADANVVDSLTKPLPQPKHNSHTVAIDIRFIKM